jgi:hypothetical protein
MRHHVRQAVGNGQLAETVRRNIKHYVYGRLAAWAQDKWPGKYDDFPAIRDPVTNGVAGILGGLLGGSSGYQIPVDLAGCQAELHRAMRRIAALEEESAATREEVDRMRPDAEAYRRLCARNAESAKKRRRGV